MPRRQTVQKLEQIELPFVVAYEGPAVDAGRISARDLGPALYSMGALIEAASEPYFGIPGAVTLQVRADFRKGSFELGLIAGVGAHLLQNLSVSDLSVLLNGIGLLGRGPKSLLRLLRIVGESPVEVTERMSTGNVSVSVTGSNNSITVINDIDPRVVKLLTSSAVREAVEETVAPVAKPGIEAYRSGSGGRAAIRITKEDLPKYRAPLTLKTELTDSASRTALELLSPNFVDGNKWRVSQGGDPFWVRMLDQDFLSHVDRGENVFMKGDFLVVDLRTRAYSTPDGLVVERDVLKVHDHKHRARQLHLDS